MGGYRLRREEAPGAAERGGSGKREPEGGMELAGHLAWRRAHLCRRVGNWGRARKWRGGTESVREAGRGGQVPGSWNLSWSLAKRTLSPAVTDKALVPAPWSD